MHLLFYLGHPAHYHLFKNTIQAMSLNKHKISILIKKKDVLENLLKEEGYIYLNILPNGRKDNKASTVFSLFKRDTRMFLYCKKHKPELMIGTSPEITHVGRLLGIKSVVLNEDDADQVPLFAKLSYPFADCILAPSSCSTGKWSNKTVYYNGYHELAYLHPDYFHPSMDKIKDLYCENNSKYFILRFAKLTAHHDKGKKGITAEVAEKIISILSPYGKVFISSEREIETQLKKYLISTNPSNIHDALYYSDLFIGDSQTMAAEAAVLGTPSIRFNDFVGKLGYLEELEHKYGLTYGIKTSEPEQLFNKISEMLSIKSLKKEWEKRKENMLKDKINVTKFLIWFLEKYPKSYEKMKNINIITKESSLDI